MPYYIFWIIGTKLYRQIVGIPMGICCAPLVVDLFLSKQAEIIEEFNLTSRYLDDLLNIGSPDFEGLVNHIYLPELQLNKTNTSDTEAPFLDLHFYISNGFVSSRIYDKRHDFDFGVVNFPFLDGDVIRCTILTEFTFLNLFGLLECLDMWLISMPFNKSLFAKLLK